jgi:hypothetical protein
MGDAARQFHPEARFSFSAAQEIGACGNEPRGKL